jgi:hypothetical protein
MFEIIQNQSMAFTLITLNLKKPTALGMLRSCTVGAPDLSQGLAQGLVAQTGSKM